MYYIYGTIINKQIDAFMTNALRIARIKSIVLKLVRFPFIFLMFLPKVNAENNLTNEYAMKHWALINPRNKIMKQITQRVLLHY